MECAVVKNRSRRILSYVIFIKIICDINFGILSANEINHADKVGCYEYFEFSLESDRVHENPYVDVLLKANVTGPNGEMLTIVGFWDGENIWKIRIMPVSPGTWSFITQSNDSSLHGVLGDFECIASERDGILMVNPEKPYSFMLSNGKPFFWMGETAWYLMSNAVPYEGEIFKNYIDIRQQQKFNNIHFVLGTGGRPYGTDNPENEGGQLWFSQENQRINPDFFKWVDRRLMYMDSVQMAIGFYITWAQHFVTFTREDFERFESYLIARYAAFPLLYWIVSGEFDEIGDPDEYDYHGQLIKQTDPYPHPVSIQPGHADPENIGTNRAFAATNWLDYIVHQLPYLFSGKNFTPDEVNAYILTDRIYNKPVVNDEFGYELASYQGNIFSAERVRKYAWAVVMGGGFPSYGHAGTIRMIEPEAVDSPGAHYMTNLYTFFEDKQWWEYAPNNALTDSGFCLTGPVSDIIAYFPRNGIFQLDLGNQAISYQTRWYNPINGTYADSGYIYGDDWQEFTTPFENDAVLWLNPVTAPEIAVNPDSLLFFAKQDSANPAPKDILILNDGGGELHWIAQESPDEPWIDLLNSSGQSGDRVSVFIEITGLTAGVYSGNIRISDPNATNNSVPVPVKLIVEEKSPKIVVQPDSLYFGVQTTSIEFTIKNNGGGALYWSIDENSLAEWITDVTPGSDSLFAGESQSVVVKINRDAMQPGQYLAQLKVLTNAGSREIIISMCVPQQALLYIEPDSIFFGLNHVEANLYLENQGEQILEWHIKNPLAPAWISAIIPDSGIIEPGNSDSLLVQADRNDLTEGIHESVISVISNGGNIDIFASIEAAGVPELSVSEAVLDFDTTQTQLSFMVINTGSGKLSWKIGHDTENDWIDTISPDSGNLLSGEKTGVTVTIERDGLEDGNYECKIDINSNGGFIQLTIIMTVANQFIEIPRMLISPDSLCFGADVAEMKFKISNLGDGILTWSIIKEGRPNWIEEIEPDSGTVITDDLQEIMVTITRVGFEPGDYSGTILVLSNADTQEVNIRMSVPDPPKISVWPTILDFAYTQNSKIFQIYNSGGDTLFWSCLKKGATDWITYIIPESGFLIPRHKAKIAVLVNRETKEKGEYHGSLLLHSNGGDQVIQIIMNVGDEPFYVKRLNCGSSTGYYDEFRRVWEKDVAYSPGEWGYIGGEMVSTVDSIECTQDDSLFQIQRAGSESYRFDVQSGIYEIWLRLAEIQYTETDKRLFNIQIEDSLIVENLDVFSLAGHDAAMDLIFTVYVWDNQLNIDFVSIVGAASIAALKVSGISPFSEIEEYSGMNNPDQFKLYPNYPNPFRDLTKIHFDLPINCRLNLRVFNMLGQVVRNTDLGYHNKGSMYIPFHAIDQSGRKLPSGVYYYEIEISGVNKSLVKTGKMILRK